MPCPLFIPSSPLGELNPGATPLGDLFGGSCAADPAYEIPSGILRCCCNFGYARDKCDLAKRTNADSTCFIISAISPEAIQVRWSLEQDHHPVSAGEILVPGNPAPPATPLEAQAQSYVSVYRRRVS